MQGSDWILLLKYYRDCNEKNNSDALLVVFFYACRMDLNPK